MKKEIMLIGIIVAVIVLVVRCFIYFRDKSELVIIEDNNSSENSSINNDSKVLIVYYSRTGNTEELAKIISDKVNGDLFKIETVKEYPSEYQEMTDVAQEEKNNNIRLEIKETKSTEEYDTVFIGCPIWWGTCPMAMFTYIESQDFTGKTIIPFTTSGGSGLGTVEDDIKESSNAKNYLKGFTVSGSNVDNSSDSVTDWLESIGF